MDAVGPETLEGGEHRGQTAVDAVAVEALGEALQIDAGRIEQRAEIVQWRPLDVTGRVHQMEQRVIAAEGGDLAHVLEKDHRLDVRGGDRGTVVARCSGDRLGRRQLVIEGLLGLRARGLPVQAGLAVQVAAGGGERQGLGSRQHVVEGLLLDRIDLHRTRVAVGDGPQGVVGILAHTTETALGGRDLAAARTEVTAHPAAAERREVGSLSALDVPLGQSGRGCGLEPRRAGQ